MLSQKYWHKIFEFGVLLKGLNGTWETLSGLLVLFLNKTNLDYWFSLLTYNEILEDPNDKLINFFATVLQNFSKETITFAAIYLIFHGILNLFLAVQLYRDKHWAYLLTTGVLMVSVFYQIYRINIHHSLILIAITIFDIIFVFLTWHEYKYHKENHGLLNEKI
jgi:uncharacterized membrane protein